MIEMGQSLGHKITAEGTEESAQFRMLQELKQDTTKRYLFSKPASAGEIVKLMTKL